MKPRRIEITTEAPAVGHNEPQQIKHDRQAA